MDEVRNLFLKSQRREGMELAAASDLLELEALDDNRYVATFSCNGLVRDAEGAVLEYNRFGVGIRFSDDYLRVVNPPEVVTWLGPREVWHPNIAAPFICLGAITPGTPLVDLLHRCFEVITFQNVTMVENDALNRPACAWARSNRDRFPIDSRPIKRSEAVSGLEISEVTP